MKRLHTPATLCALLLASHAAAYDLDPNCNYTAHRTIARDTGDLQCLARDDSSGNPIEWPVPIQNDPAAYATECDVVLTGSDEFTHCTRRWSLDGHALRIHYDDGVHTLSLWNMTTGDAVLDGVAATAHPAEGPLEYLSYDAGDRTYYVFLVDPEPGETQKKFYKVEVFDEADAHPGCIAELPATALQRKPSCAAPAQFGDFMSRLPAQGGSGGGYEPPK